MMRVFTFIFAFFAVLATGAENLNTWQKQMPITFSGYTPPGNETLTNFPALIILSNTTAGAGFNYDDFLSPPYGDLRFTASDKITLLNFEVEKWDTNGNSYVWVQVPELAGTNTQICAFWGKSGVSPPACTTNGAVWTEGFAGVWHMTTTNAQDSTSNSNHGVAGGAVTNTAGKVDGADSFDGSTGYINCGNSTSLNLTQITVEAWADIGAWTGNWHMLVSKGYDGNAVPYNLALQPSGQPNKIGFGTFANLTWKMAYSGGTVASGNRYHLVGTFDGTAFRIYTNGNLDGIQAWTGSLPTTVKPVGFGGSPDWNGIPDHYFTGILDEIRISNIPRSPNWIWACYMNMASNGIFNTYGEITLGGMSGTIIYAW